ncbi:MAG: molybdopterin-dependent oxidoreductase [Chloroflexota bacterium]
MAAGKMITVSVDGTKVQVPDGTYVWDVCRMVGIEIPNFCYLPGLRAYGACRMCVVEVSGRRGFELVTSCSTPSTDGMEVRTVNERIWQQRNMIMEALDTDHPVDCPICEANGDCRLQDYGYEYGVTGDDTRRPKIVRPAERLSPAIDIDRDRCVVCGRCVRVCDEVIGAVALAFVERGVETLIDAPFGKSLLETPCTSCGQCVEVCPVGALSSRINLKMEHHWWQRKTETTCTYCSVGCTIKLGSTRNQVYEVRSDDALGLNDGVTCVKGRFAMDFVNSNNRLSTPLVRRNGRLETATWDEALDVITTRLSANKGRVGVVASPKLSNEENYLLQKVARLGLGTNNIDYDGRSSESPALDVLADMLGYPAQTNNLIDTRQKAGCIVNVGESIYESHPVYAYQLQRMIRLMDKKLIVISPRWTKMCEWATLWLAPKAGTEETLIGGMARVILDAGLIDQAYLDSRTENGPQYIASLQADAFSLANVSSVTGVPVRDIVAAAYLYASGGSDNGPENLPQPTHPSNLPTTKNGAADSASAANVTVNLKNYTVKKPDSGFPPSTIVFPAAGPYTLTTQTVAALTGMALATGNIGRPGAGVNPFVSDSNCLGANDMGCLPAMFPGYRPVNADNARELEELWSVTADRTAPELSAEPGLSLAAMLAAAYDGELNAMWIVGSNPVLGMEEPQANMVREALRKLDFLVVQDIFVNETAELADVILPAASFAEKDGTTTNTERRVQRIRQAIQPAGASKTDLQIISMIGQRLGVELPAVTPKDVFEEIGRVVPQYAGMTYARLDMTEFIDDQIPMPAAVSLKQLKVKSLMWPCPDRLHPGTPVLYTETFATPSGKAKLWTAAPQIAASSRQASGNDTLMATFGFPLFPFRTGTLSRQSYGLSRVEPDPRLHLNSLDAARMGIDDQVPVSITVDGVDNSEPIFAVSLVYDRIPEGTAFLAMTMEQAGTNRAVRIARHTITSDTTGSKKSVAIQVRPAPNMGNVRREELQPVATANVLDPGDQPI